MHASKSGRVGQSVGALIEPSGACGGHDRLGFHIRDNREEGMVDTLRPGVGGMEEYGKGVWGRTSDPEPQLPSLGFFSKPGKEFFFFE